MIILTTATSFPPKEAVMDNTVQALIEQKDLLAALWTSRNRRERSSPGAIPIPKDLPPRKSCRGRPTAPSICFLVSRPTFVFASTFGAGRRDTAFSTPLPPHRHARILTFCNIVSHRNLVFSQWQPFLISATLSPSRNPVLRSIRSTVQSDPLPLSLRTSL